MKATTLNLSFTLQRLKSNNVLLLVFFIILGTSFTQRKSEIKEANAAFYSKENHGIEFSEDSTYLIVIKNNKCCMNCFAVISDYVLRLKNNSEINLVAIAHSDSTSLARKRNLFELKTIFPEFKGYGVTYSKCWDDSSPTPELLIIKNKETYQFTYSEIFADGFEFVSPTLQTQISKILKIE